MTTNELLSLARMSIRHQDFRLRELIKKHESKSKQAILKTLKDIEEKAAKAIATAKQFENSEETDMQETFASFIHYANSYAEKTAELKAILKNKSDALTKREQELKDKRDAKAALLIAKKQQRLEKIQKDIETAKQKLESLEAKKRA